MEDAGRQLEETIVTSIKDRVYLRLCSGHVPIQTPPSLSLPILTIFRLLPKYLEEWWHLLLVSKKRKIVTTGKKHNHDLGLATE